MSITQLLEWLRALLFGRSTPGSHLATPALPPVERLQGPAPYVRGSRLVDAPRRRTLVRPLPGPHGALPPPNWAAFQPDFRRSDASPAPVCTCPQYGPRRDVEGGER